MSSASHDKRENAGVRLLAEFNTLHVSRRNLLADDIHRLRVAIKQTRAWLRLCRALTGKTAQFEQLMQNLQHLSRILSGTRDLYVALQTLDKLGRKYPGKKAQQLIEELRHAFTAAQTPAPEAESLYPVIEQIRSDLTSFIRLKPSQDSQLSVIRPAYAKMCQSGEAALATESCADLHAWRKRVKTLGYQLAMLEQSLPHAKKSLVVFNKLGSRLGEIHDLCFLQEMVEDADAQGQFTHEPGPLLKRISRERYRLIALARKHHEQICPPPARWFSNS